MRELYVLCLVEFEEFQQPAIQTKLFLNTVFIIFYGSIIHVLPVQYKFTFWLVFFIARSAVANFFARDLDPQTVSLDHSLYHT
jgi:hypothetical protein